MAAMRWLFPVLLLASTAPAHADAWLRRVWLDLAGAPPPVAQVRAFDAKPDAGARRAVVERLVASPECAARWARLLAAPLVSPADGAARPLERFLEKEIAGGAPWWKTLGALVTPGKAAALIEKPVRGDGVLIAGAIGSGMLGVRLRCARCHDDPGGWSAADHYGLAAFYGRPRTIQAPARLVAAYRAGRIRTLYDLVMHLPTMQPRGPDHRWVRAEVNRGRELLAQLHRMGIGPGPPDFAGLDWAAYDVYRLHAQRARMPKMGGGFGATTGIPVPGTIEALRMPRLVELAGARPPAIKPGQAVAARVPGEAAVRDVARRREVLAAWVASPENRFTARALVNRVRAALMGRGLVEPVDEVERPADAAGAERLDALAREHVQAGGSVRGLLARLALSPEYSQADGPVGCPLDNSTAVEASGTATAPGAADEGEATQKLATFRFPDAEAGCTRERGRDPVAALGARGMRLLDGDQLAAALGAATGEAVEEPVRREVAIALELWAASAAHEDGDAARTFPPRMLAAGTELGRLVLGARALAELAACGDDAGRVDALFVRTLSRSPSSTEAARALEELRARGPAGLLLRLVTSAEFLTNR